MTVNDGQVDYDAQVAKQVADYLHMEAPEIEKLMRKEHLEQSEIVIAAVISKKRNKNLHQVIKERKMNQNWGFIDEADQLKPEEFWQEMEHYFPRVSWYPHVLQRHPTVLTDALIHYLGEDKRTIKHLIRQTHYSAVKAAILAKASGKSLDQILALKARESSWEEVEKDLHVKPQRIEMERKRLKAIVYQEIKKWKKHQKAITQGR